MHSACLPVPRFVLCSILLAAFSTAGCALTLDDPHGPDASLNGALDTGATRVDDGSVVADAGRDAGRVDATVADDAATTSDAGLTDAASTDGATEAGTADAALPDAGSDAAIVLDASAPDATVSVCVGVHPIVGPPRTCNPGSCLCVGTDACFTVDTVASCCTGAFVCAAPIPECAATHPIVGPPRTCTSGSCYCANPDACFPSDGAARCCAVPVVCVP